MTARAKLLVLGLSVFLVLPISSTLQCMAASRSVDRDDELQRMSPARNLTEVSGYWPLNEGEGITAYDLSGNGNHGTLLNGPTWVPGISGNAVEFDGVDDLIDMDDSPSLDIRRDLWINVWIKPHVNDRLMSIIGKWGGTDGVNRSYVLNIGGYPEDYPHGSHPGRLCLLLTPDGGTHYLLASTDVVPTNEWTHVLATYDGTTMALYINDILDATQVVPMGDIFSGNAQLQIGSTESEPTEFKFDGVIDEAQVGGDIDVEPEPDEGDPYLRYGWVCGDLGPCTCKMPGWNPPAGGACLPPPTYYANGFDTVDAYPGQQLAMRVMCANHAADSPDVFCVRILGYPPGWTFSGDPTLGSGTFLNPGYGWWQTTYINVPCYAGLDSYNRVIIQQNYYHGAPCIDAGDKEVPNTRQCTYGDPCTTVMYREDTLFVHIVAAPSALVVLYDTLPTLVERGQPQAYIAFSLCNGDPCAPPTRTDYNIVSKGYVGPAINTTGYVMVPGGECRDVYGIVDASLAEVCTHDTLTIIAWMGTPQADVRGSWPLNEGEGITAHDLSGNGNHGTLLNGPTWTSGISGNAIEFDGVDDLIDMDDSPSLDIRRDLWINVWIKPHVNDRLMNIIGKWGVTDGYNRSYVLNIGGYPEDYPHGSHPGRLCLLLTPDGGTHYLLASTDVVPTNEWTHVLATYDGTTMALSINDILNATQVVPMGDIFSGNAQLQIGSTESEPTEFKFDGVIDEAQVGEAYYDTRFQIVHVIEPRPVPLFTAPVMTILVLALFLAAGVFIRRRVVSKV